MRYLVGQSLADHSLHRLGCPLGVGNFKHLALVVPKIELCQIPLQMLLRNMVICASDPALKNGEIRLNGIGVRITANVFLNAVVDGLMPRALRMRSARWLGM